MRIDAHGHACAGYATLESLLNELDKHKIDKVILFPAEIGKDKVDKIPNFKNIEILYYSNIIGAFFTRFANLSKKVDFGNTYVHYLKLLAPERIIQFYQITPNYLYKLQADYEKMRFSGIKLHQCLSYFGIKSKFFNSVLDFAEKHNLPVQIHLCKKKDAIDLIESVKGKNVKIIIAHLLFPKLFAAHWDEIGSKIYFDLANYYFINPATIEFALSRFGSEKLIFGSDNPFGIDAIKKTIDLVMDLPISQKEKELIMGGNIQKILSI